MFPVLWGRGPQWRASHYRREVCVGPVRWAGESNSDRDQRWSGRSWRCSCGCYRSGFVNVIQVRADRETCKVLRFQSITCNLLVTEVDYSSLNGVTSCLLQRGQSSEGSRLIFSALRVRTAAGKLTLSFHCDCHRFTWGPVCTSSSCSAGWFETGSANQRQRLHTCTLKADCTGRWGPLLHNN